MPQQKDIEYFTLLFNKEFSVWYDNKNLIRIIMYVISLLFIIYLFSLLLNLGKDTPVSGEENAYEIKSAEFEARLNNDGSAEITETWTVKSNRGASMEFIRQIEEPLNNAGKFEDLTDLYVSINRSTVSEMDSSSDQGFRLQRENNNYVIHVYVYSQVKYDTIVIRYHLHNIVKNVEDEYYLFSYRFLGNHDPERLDNTHLLILSPEGSKLTKVDSESESGKSKLVSKISNTCVRITDESKSGPLQVTMRMEGNDNFHGAIPIKRKELEKRNYPSVHDIVKYFLIPGIVKYLKIILLCCLCLIIIISKAVNYNYYAFIKKKTVWGEGSNYTQAFSLTENEINKKQCLLFGSLS